MSLNVKVLNIAFLTLAVATVSPNSAVAQRGKAQRSAIAQPLVGSMAPKAFAALTQVNVHGIKVGMSIGAAQTVLKELGYDFEVTPTMFRNVKTARLVALKGKRDNNYYDRERFDLYVLMDRPHDPRRPQPYNPDWPIIQLDYVLDDRDNQANVKGFAGYDWTGTAEHAITEQARDVVCGALVAEGLACTDSSIGFSAGPLQNGTLGGGRMYINEGMTGEYKISITAQKIQ